MCEDRWANIALEVQTHIDAICSIAKRENLEVLSIYAKGILDDRRNGASLVSSCTYVDEAEDAVYSGNLFSGGELKFEKNCEEFKTYIQA